MRFYDNLLGHDLTDPKLQLNKRGHRCKDIEDINLNSYILFAGDNVALDFNSSIEQTYPYLISKQLNMDYYNLAIFNGGIDAAKYNILSWLRHMPKPKSIVVSFEFLNSIINCSPTFDDFKVADYNDPSNQQILRAGETTGFFPARHTLTKNALVNLINVPIYQIEFKNKTPLFTEDPRVINIKSEGELFDHRLTTELFLKKHSYIKGKILP